MICVKMADRMTHVMYRLCVDVCAYRGFHFKALKHMAPKCFMFDFEINKG